LPHLGPRAAACAQLVIAIYGGYFAGGIGFLMLAALTAAGSLGAQCRRHQKPAGGGDGRLLGAVYSCSRSSSTGEIVAPVAAAAVLGGQAGVYLLRRINETALCASGLR
jgi:uncharacterized protein